MKVVCIDHAGAFEYNTTTYRVDHYIKVAAPWEVVAQPYVLSTVLSVGDRVVPVYTRKY